MSSGIKLEPILERACTNLGVHPMVGICLARQVLGIHPSTLGSWCAPNTWLGVLPNKDVVHTPALF